MAGSKVNNIKLDPKKQKIVECVTCGEPLVVGKFTKLDQTCETANYYPSKCPKRKYSKDKVEQKSARKKIDTVKQNNPVIDDPPKKDIENKIKDDRITSKYIRSMNQLGFEIDKNRNFKKKYGIDGGGVMTVYPHISNGIAGEEPKLEWFSVILQRAIGVNEEFRRFMPPDAASDCELLASELAEQNIIRPEVGMTSCDNCGSVTDQFGVKSDRVLCVKPNNCFKKSHTNAQAEAEV